MPNINYQSAGGKFLRYILAIPKTTVGVRGQGCSLGGRFRQFSRVSRKKSRLNFAINTKSILNFEKFLDSPYVIFWIIPEKPASENKTYLISYSDHKNFVSINLL